MSPWHRFLVEAVLFHATYLGACVLVLRRWLKGGSAERVGWAAFGVDALCLAGTAAIAGTLAGLVGPRGEFTLFRLLAQALFGETFLLASMGACLFFARRRHVPQHGSRDRRGRRRDLSRRVRGELGNLRTTRAIRVKGGRQRGRRNFAFQTNNCPHIPIRIVVPT